MNEQRTNDVIALCIVVLGVILAVIADYEESDCVNVLGIGLAIIGILIFLVGGKWD
jgi:uncharacterized membrane protein